MKNGFLRVGLCSPTLIPYGYRQNAEQIKENIIMAHAENVQVLLFPEYAVSGGVLANLDHGQVEQALKLIAQATKNRDILVFVPSTLQIEGRLYSAILAFQGGLIIGATLKKNITQNERQYIFSYDRDIYHQIEISHFVTPVKSSLIYNKNDLSIITTFFGYFDPNFTLTNNIDLVLCLGDSINVEYFNHLSSITPCCSAVICGSNKLITEMGAAYVVSNKPLCFMDVDIDKINFLQRSNITSPPSSLSYTIPIKLKNDYCSISRPRLINPLEIVNESAAQQLINTIANNLYMQLVCYGGGSISFTLSTAPSSAFIALIADNLISNGHILPQNVTCHLTQKSQKRLIAFCQKRGFNCKKSAVTEQNNCATISTICASSALSSEQFPHCPNTLYPLLNLSHTTICSVLSFFSQSAFSFKIDYDCKKLSDFILLHLVNYGSTKKKTQIATIINFDDISPSQIKQTVDSIICNLPVGYMRYKFTV